MFSVTISEKGGQQSQYEFAKPQITIGRMKGNDIVLPKGNVSKQHTRIFLREDNFFVVDLKSTNGTYVNGRKVTAEQAVGESDKIYIGDFILQLQRQTGQQPQGSPPQPPPPRPSGPGGAGGPGGGSRPGGGRHFPTVMDAGDRGGGPAPAAGAATQRNPSVGGSGPTGSSPGTPRPGGGGNFPMGQRASSQPGNTPQPGGPPQGQTPAPSPADNLRKTMGEAPGAPAELTPEIEPIEDSPATPIPGASPSAPGPGPQTAPTPTPAPAPNPTPAPAPATGSAPAGRPPAPAPLAGSSSAQPSASTLAQQSPLESEFDEEFHRKQQDVAKIFFESLPISDLPLDYPIEDPALEQRVQSTVTSAVGSAGAGADADDLTDILTKEAVGLGPLEDYLDDPQVEAIYINAFDRIVVRRQGKLVVAANAFSHPDMLDLAARRLLGPQDPMPVSDEVRFGDGTRVHILMPPVAVDGPALTVRKPNQSFPDLDELVEDGAMSEGMAEFLERAVEAGRSIVIAGPVSSGKTTLLAALTQTIPSSSRVIALEQHSNLALEQPNFIRLEASPASGFDMRYLLTNAVAMHPDRILLDQCRGPEAYEWVTAAASGTAGSMVTLHGTGALDALSRFESLCLLAAGDISPRGLREQVARSVNLVVVLNNRPDGGFRVQQIAEVQGVDLDAFRLNDIFYFRVEGSAGAFHPTGYIPLFYEDLRHAGLDVDLGIFRE